MLAFLLQLFIDSFECIFLLFHLCCDILTIQILPEFQECSYISDECLAYFYGLTHRIGSFQQILQLHKVHCMNQVIQLEVMLLQIIRSCSNSFQYMLDELFLIHCGIIATFAIRISRIVSQCLAQCFHDSYIVDDQSIRFPFCHSVGARNGLHQRMGFHGFVDI